MTPKFVSDENSSESDDSTFTRVFREIRRMESEEEWETLLIILAMLAVFIATSCGMFCLFALFLKRRDASSESSKSHLRVHSCGPYVVTSSAPPMDHQRYPTQ